MLQEGLHARFTRSLKRDIPPPPQQTWWWEKDAFIYWAKVTARFINYSLLLSVPVQHCSHGACVLCPLKHGSSTNMHVWDQNKFRSPWCIQTQELKFVFIYLIQKTFANIWIKTLRDLTFFCVSSPTMHVCKTCKFQWTGNMGSAVRDAAVVHKPISRVP